MRAKLLRLSEDNHVLILNFHHIVCDGSSLIIFYQELAALYEAFLDGKASTLPSLPVQYADYAVWQHQWLQGEVLESQLAYWKRQLGTGLTTLNLPTDYERPVVQTYRGARLTRTLSDELTEGLKDLSRREGVTLFMTLLATLDILLSRHTGQDDIIVGSTIAGRNRPETDGLIGFFINALALRTDLSGNPTFLELLKRVREVCLDAYTHQDLPFEKVVEEINPQRDLSRNPLFQVMFNMADTSERVLKLAGCTVIKLSPAEPEAKFDIVLHAPEVDGRLNSRSFTTPICLVNIVSSTYSTNSLTSWSKSRTIHREESTNSPSSRHQRFLLFPTPPNLSMIHGKDRSTSCSPSRLSGRRIFQRLSMRITLELWRTGSTQ